MSISNPRKDYAALQGALTYTQSIVDTVRDPMLVLDGRLRVQTASRNFCKTFKVSAEETVGRLVYELGDGQWDIPRLRELLEIILPQHTAFNEFEVEHDFPQIGHRIMLLNARKLWRTEDNLELILLGIEDITERKEHEDEMERTRSELKRSNEDLEQFARIAAHDLRNPLNTMVQSAQLLARRNRVLTEAPDNRELLDYIINNGNHLGRLLEDMLRYATVAHTPLMETQPVAAIEACKQAADNLRAKVQASGAVLHCEEAPDVKVRVPQSLLSQVFENLIGNAIHYGREGVPVVVNVSAEADKNCWLFSVQDNGLGIAAQYHETIFEPFRRLHGGDRPGSGIGLATCRRVIERAGGRIWVESAVYEGSTFRFLLPKA